MQDFLTLILTFTGLILVIYQVRALNIQSRKEKALDFVNIWKNDSTVELSVYQKLAFALSKSEIQNIKKFKEFTVKKSIILETAPFLLKEKGFKVLDKNLVLVSSKKSSEIRTSIIKTLNLVEMLGTAYLHGSIDKKIIHDGFYMFFIEHNYLDNVIHMGRNYNGEDGDWKTIVEFRKALAPDVVIKPYAESLKEFVLGTSN